MRQGEIVVQDTAISQRLAGTQPCRVRTLVSLLTGGVFWLAVTGCAPTFEAHPARAETAGTTGALAGESRNWTPALCLQTLRQTSSQERSERPRLATARLMELYAPELLAAPRHAIRVPAGDGTYRLRLRRGTGAGGVEPSRFAALEPVDRFEVSGVKRSIRVAGAGAPLVGTLRPTLPVVGPGPVPPQPAAGLTWAVTAVPVRDEGGRTVTLELFDPHVAGRGVSHPLAADFTTPLAVANTRFRPQARGVAGFMRADGDYFPSAGLYPTESPSPDKTPLILVHGLISDPGDFRDLRNSLAGDPRVRRRYQVWVFYYPTSLPVPYSAMLLRESLAKLVHQLDSDGDHPAIHRAVLVAHSMGGLLSRMTISDGGDIYYHHFFRAPLDDLQLTAPERALVRRAFYYRASPDVGRVVFIATPHRGSKLAGGLLGNIGRLLVRVPRAVRARITPIVARNQTALAPGAPLKPGSSLDSLSPSDPLIAAVGEMSPQPGVRLNSILGDRGRGGPVAESSDGVVPYVSSHLDGVESERMVPAGHTGTLSREETAAELNRILDQTTR